MAEAPLLGVGNLPDEIVVWEILVRLDPKSLLRCRAVRRDWRCATSTRCFLLAHHAHQPALPIFSAYDQILGVRYNNIRAFDHRAAAAAQGDQLHTVAGLDDDDGAFHLEASCDGIVVLSKFCLAGTRTWLSVCNPATREHASLSMPSWHFDILGIYSRQSTDDYRLLLLRRYMDSPEDQIGCYVFPLGSDQPPRYIGCPETALWWFDVPVLVRDSLHWYPSYCLSESNPLQHQSDSKPLVVFDTISESFRRMHAPVVSTKANIFDMDGTLGIYKRNYAMKQFDVYPFLEEKDIVDIWVLRNYENEVWDLKYRITLPLTEIREQFWNHSDYSLDVVSWDDDVLVLFFLDQYLIPVDSKGELLDSFNLGCKNVHLPKCRLKQSLVQHTFFPSLEGYVVNASPWSLRPPCL